MENYKLNNFKKLFPVYFFRTLFFKNDTHSESYGAQNTTRNSFHLLENNWIGSLFSEQKPVRYLVPFLFLLFIGLNTANAQKTWDGGAETSNWGDANNWNNNTLPTSSDAVTLAASGSSGADLSVTVNITNAVCASLQIGGSSADTRATLTFASSGSPKLSVTGAVTVGGSGSTNANRGGTITFVSGATLEAGSIVLTQSTSGSNNDNPGTITMTSGSTLITGSFAIGQGSATWTPSTGTVNLKDTNTLPASVFTTFNNLIISQGTTTTGRALTIASLTVNSADTFSLSHAVTANAVSLEGGCASTGGTISGSSTLTLGGNVAVTDNGGGTVGATISCPVALSATRTFTVADDGTSAIDLTMSGVISGSTFGVTKAGTGTLTLSGLNTYTGATTVSAGTLKAGVATTGANGAFGNASAVTLANAASTIIDITGFNTTIGSITGGGGTGGNVTLGAATLTIGANNTSPAAYAGIISGTGAITKNGSGALILSGANTYTGATSVSAGTLKLGVSSSVSTSGPLGTTGSGTTVTSGAALDLNGFSLTSSATEALSLNGTGISSGGALTNSSSTASNYIGLITIASTTSIITNAGDVNLTNTGAISSDGLVVTIGGSGNGQISGVFSANTSITKIGSGTWTLSGTNTYAGPTLISTGTLKLGNTSALGSASGSVTVASGGALDLNGYSLSVVKTTSISGTGVASLGAITNSSSTSAVYSGTITLAANSSIVGETGSIAISNIQQLTGAGFTLTLGGTTGGSFSSILNTGSGGLTKIGSGTWTINAHNYYNGTTTISAGTLKLGIEVTGNLADRGPLGSNTAGTTVAAGAVLDLNGYSINTSSTPEALTLNGSGISSGGALTNTGADATFNGAITLATASTIAATTSGSLTCSGTVAGAFALTLGGAGTGTMSGVISTPTSLTKSGAGTWVLSGTNTYTGATAVTAGVLNIRNVQGTGTTAGGVTVSSGAALQLEGGITVGAEALTLNGTGVSNDGALRSVGTGNLTNTWGGTITLGSTARINADASSTLSIGAITGSTISLSLGGNGSINVTGAITTGTGGVTDDGPGNVTFSGTNTYTGATTIEAGITSLGKSSVFANTSNLVLSGGTFKTGTSTGFSDTMGTLTLSANSTFALGGSAHTLTFSASSGVAWAGTVLTISGWAGTAGSSGTAGKIIVGTTSSGLTSAQLAKFSFTGYGTGGTQLSTGEVVPKIQVPEVTSATTASSTYGTASSYTITGSNTPTSYNATVLPTGMSVNTTTGVITVAATTAAGTYSITISATNGGGTGSATLSYTVNTKALTITGLTGSNKVYDGNDTATVTGTAALSGVVSGDSANVTLGGTPAYAFGDAAVGTAKTITASGFSISGTASGNYSLTQPTGLTANITAATPTIVVTVGSYTYSGATQGPTAVTGNSGSGTVTWSYVGTGSTTYAASSTLPTNAGTYTATASVTANGNYGAASSSATAFTIAQAPLTITANDQTNCAGTTFTFAGTEFTTSGLVNGNTVSSATLTSTGSASNAAAGTYPIVATNAAGTGLANYTISYVNGTLTVNASPTTTDTTICTGGSGSLTVTSSCTDITGQTSGPNDAGTGANLTGVGSTAWSNPGNITSVGSPYATVAPAQQGTSNYLKASTYGFSIPANAIINGIQLTINRSSTQSFGTGNRDDQVRLVKNHVLQAADKSSNSVYPTSLTSQSYGGATDLWGTTWTADDINNSGFGAVLSVFNTRIFDNATATVNFMQITVTYTIPGSFEWYTVSSGGTAIGSGSTFNPVGVANSGLANTNTAGTTPYWVACSTAEGSCRTKADFIINALPTVTSATGNSKTYTGIANATTVSALASAGSTIDWYDASTGGTLLESGTLTYAPTGINAGTYTVYAQARNTTTGCTSAARTSATLTINVATPTVTVTVGTYTYNASAQGPTAATNTGTGSSYTFSYVGTGSTTYAASSTLPIAAGTYTATATVAANGNDGSASSSATAFTIAVKSVTITALDQFKCVGENYNLPTNDYTVTGLVAPQTIGSVSLSSTGSPSNANVGTYPILAGNASGGSFNPSNYSISYVEGTLTVAPLAVGGTASVPSSTLCTGSSTVITLTNYTGNIQWQSSNNGSSWTAITDATNSTYTTPNLTQNTYYRAIVTSGDCASVSSSSVSLTIQSAPTAVLSGTSSTCAGGSRNLIVTVNGAGSPYTVVYSDGTTNNFTVNSYVSGTNISVSPAANTTYTLISVTTASGCTATISGSAVVTVFTATTTWSGTAWSNGEPDASKVAIISGAFTSPGSAAPHNLTACRLTVTNNATVLIKSGDSVTLNGSLTVNTGSVVTFNSGASLLQTGTTNENSGSIVVKRDSSRIKRLDYTLWSSPVENQGLYSFSPTTLSNRFYVYNAQLNTYSNTDVGFNLTNLQYPSPLVAPVGINGTDSANVPFVPAKGYLIRTPWNHATSPTAWSGTFTGKPNNGTISMPLTDYGIGKRFNLIGNPYPSAIDADTFIQTNIDNGSITGTVYFYRKTNGANNGSYCSQNLVGYTSNGDPGISSMAMNPFSNAHINIVPVGQGFFVEGTGAGTGSVVFTNEMRINTTSNRFFKTTNTVERNRIWLNVTNATGSFSQAMIGYMTGATQGVDTTIDGKLFSDGAVALASLIGTDSYVIQGRALPFDASDEVPLSLKITTAGDYTITIDHVDGLFSDGAQTVYLRDNTTGIVHNLSAEGYTFASAAGTFDTRFDIVYQTSTLAVSIPTFNESQVVIYKTPTNEISINTGNIVMSMVKIFDIRGRLLQELKDINATQTVINAGLSTEILLVQITSEEGIVVTKKVLFPRTSLKLDKNLMIKTQVAEDE